MTANHKLSDMTLRTSYVQMFFSGSLTVSRNVVTMKCAPIILITVLLTILVMGTDANVYNVKNGESFSTGQRTQVVQGPGGRTVKTDTVVQEGGQSNPIGSFIGSLFQPFNFNAHV